MGELLNGLMNYGGDARPERLDKFFRTHLERHLLITGVCGDVPMSAALADRLISDPRGSTDLRDVSERAAREFPGIEAAECNAHMIETVLRESVGLDGNDSADGLDQMRSEPGSDPRALQIRANLEPGHFSGDDSSSP